MTNPNFEEMRKLAQDFATETAFQESFSTEKSIVFGTAAASLSYHAELQDWKYAMWQRGFGTYTEIEQGLETGKFIVGVFPPFKP